MQTFDHSAQWYDAVYAARGKDYAVEAKAICAHAQRARRMESPIASLLDVACGTGAHLRHFQQLIPHCEGADASAAMLDVARATLVDVPLHHQSMTELHLARRFDCVTSLFASIGYLSDIAAVRMAIARMADHLAPGGALAMEPAVLRERVTAPTTSTMSIDLPDAILTRVTSGALNDERTTLSITFEYECIRKDGRATAITEEHPIQLYSDDEYRRAMADAGLTEIAYDPDHGATGLYLALRTEESSYS